MTSAVRSSRPLPDLLFIHGRRASDSFFPNDMLKFTQAREPAVRAGPERYAPGYVTAVARVRAHVTFALRTGNEKLLERGFDQAVVGEVRSFYWENNTADLRDLAF